MKTEGEPSKTIELRTDVTGPSAPVIVNLTCDISNNTLHVSWERPVIFFNSIDYFFIQYRSEDKSDTEFEELAVPGGGVNSRELHSVGIQSSFGAFSDK